MKTLVTPEGIYKTGVFQSCNEVWYGKMVGDEMTLITKKEFELAINYKKPELDPLPF